jgi:hypothetical protein
VVLFVAGWSRFERRETVEVKIASRKQTAVGTTTRVAFFKRCSDLYNKSNYTIAIYCDE